MKIAIITDGIWPYVIGGMQKHSYYLCKYFAKNGITVDLYHFNDSAVETDLSEVFTEEENRFIHSFEVEFPNTNKGPGHYLKNSYLYSKAIFEVIKDKVKEYDFIYTKGFSGWYLIEQKYFGKIKCCEIGVKFHGYEMFQKAPDFKTKLQQHLLLRKPVKEISQKADVVFSYGGKITEIIKEIGVEEKKIVELPAGVEESTIVNDIHSTSSIIKMAYLGRYERRKGVEELSQALKLIDPKLNFEFHFIGAIPKQKEIKLPHVKYHGEVRGKKLLNNLLQTYDVLVCPSWSEGMPNVILEAMSNGLCVVATNTGATNLLVNEKTGWLIENAEVNTIKTTLERIIQTSTDIIEDKQRAALDLIRESFTWEKLIQELIIKIKINL